LVEVGKTLSAQKDRYVRDMEEKLPSASTLTNHPLNETEASTRIPTQHQRLEDDLSVLKIDDRNSESKITFKIVLLGNTSVGKSCFLLRYFDDQFVIPSVTIGVDFVCNLSIICFYSLSEDTYSRLRQSTHSNPNGLFLVSSFDL
jgi:hypothetical protein